MKNGVLQNHRPPTGHPPLSAPGPPPTHRTPTTDRWPTEKCSTDPSTTNNRPPTHRQVLYWPTEHQQPTHRHVLHRPTDHQLTDSPTLLQLTNNPLTHQTYFSRFTIGPILSITNFNSSFGMGTIYYWIRKIIYKMIYKKERW